MFIGKKIREIRESKSMTLSSLAEASGVQIATLSRIEHHKMTGTLESHMNIAKALGVDLPALYSDIVKDESKIDLQTPDSKTDMFVHSERSSYEILTNKVLSKKMMPFLLRIEAEGKTNYEQNKPGSEKFIYVLQGNVEVNIGGVIFPLPTGNSLYFDSSVNHCIQNTAKLPAKVFCVVTPVAL